MEKEKKLLKNKALKRANESAKVIAASTAVLIAKLLKEANLLHDNVSWLRGHIELLSRRDIETITDEMIIDIVTNLTIMVGDAPKLLNLSILVSSAIKEAAGAQKYLESLKT